jgi:hypothetical protein
VSSLGLVVGLALLSLVGDPAAAADLNFRRGDTNSSGDVDMSDAIRTFTFLFVDSSVSIPCRDAADANDSGTLDLSDGIFTLNFLFVGGPQPPAPGPNVCGPDPSPDSLSCDDYTAPNCDQTPPPPSGLREIGHVLNRLGYGPSQGAVDHVQALGL